MTPRTAMAVACLSLVAFASGAAEPRARDLGVPFDGTPGRFNAITDVAGVEVGFKTLISGEGRLVIGKGPVRTGVTAIFPRGKAGTKSVFAGYFAGNGNGDMTGTHWIEESGLLETPILITNTGSVGVVRDAAVAWMVRHEHYGKFWYPVAAETADWPLNDIRGQHVTTQDAWDALDSAASGPLPEGNVGGGTGMVLQRIQGRHRHLVASARGKRRRLHRRRARAVQLRPKGAAARGRHSGGARDDAAASLRRKDARPSRAGLGRLDRARLQRENGCRDRRHPAV